MRKLNTRTELGNSPVDKLQYKWLFYILKKIKLKEKENESLKF